VRPGVAPPLVRTGDF